jgi:hypothetical protein
MTIDLSELRQAVQAYLNNKVTSDRIRPGFADPDYNALFPRDVTFTAVTREIEVVGQPP